MYLATPWLVVGVSLFFAKNPGSVENETHLPGSHFPLNHDYRRIGGRVCRLPQMFPLGLGLFYRHSVGDEFLWHSSRAGHAPCLQKNVLKKDRERERERYWEMKTSSRTPSFPI